MIYTALVLSISPFFFAAWYQWRYRWEIYDGGADPFWRRLRRDIHISLPGRHGDIARITLVRRYVRKFARLEGKNSVVHYPGITGRFRAILKHRQYQTYEHLFLAPKWLIWCMIGLSLVWPIALVLVTVNMMYHMVRNKIEDL